MKTAKKKVTKFDFKKEFKFLFNAPKNEPEIINVPDLKYIMIDGEGNPNTAKEFGEKIQVLYGIAFTIKFTLKLDKDDPYDFSVPPLSGLWCADDITAYAAGRKDEWKWTLMILMPDRVTEDDFKRAKEKVREKKDPAYLDLARFGIYKEGAAAQIMHTGPYSAEGPTIKKLHEFFREKGYTFNGKHHEIYLSDPRRAKPEKMKTIIRQPIKKA
ncbi:MAG: GyrI-like domain-containing protein [bacterium]|nr:GyrI-like domain-containing protein [bacterium]